MSKRFTIQQMHSKIYFALCADTNHDGATFEIDETVKNELKQKITFP